MSSAGAGRAKVRDLMLLVFMGRLVGGLGSNTAAIPFHVNHAASSVNVNSTIPDQITVRRSASRTLALSMIRSSATYGGQQEPVALAKARALEP